MIVSNQTMLEVKKTLLKDIKLGSVLKERHQQEIKIRNSFGPEMDEALERLTENNRHRFIERMYSDAIRVFQHEAECAYGEHKIQ